MASPEDDWKDAPSVPLAPSDFPVGELPAEVKEKAREMQAILAREVKATQDTFRAGLLAGLREAAALADQHAEAMTKRLAKPGLSEFDEGLFESAHTEASYIAAAIRALIAPAGEG